uniref:4Fe-4S Wbl-type domain-containing protein n=1 Tax=Plectus sambesii TaxID=2011161 RepID=A0A914W148_9BILA
MPVTIETRRRRGGAAKADVRVNSTRDGLDACRVCAYVWCVCARWAITGRRPETGIAVNGDEIGRERERVCRPEPLARPDGIVVAHVCSRPNDRVYDRLSPAHV